MTTPDALRRWLLHDLSDAQASEWEERLFEDDAVSAQLLDAEHDLFDDYARGRLDENERRALRRHLLATPSDRARLRFARALAAHVPSRSMGEAAPARRRHARRATWLVLAAACLGAIAVGVVHLRRERGAETVAEPSNLPVFVLMANVQRGAAPTTLTLPNDASAIRLQLEAADGIGPYSVTISSAPGARAFHREGLQAQQAGPYRYVEVVVPTAALNAATQITLESPDASPYRWAIESQHPTSD